MQPAERDLFRRPELRTAAAALAAVAAGVLLVLVAVREHTDLLFDDLGSWQISAPGRELQPSFVASLRPPGPQQPFRLDLMLDRIPRAGDAVVADAHLAAPSPGLYCFEVFLSSDYYNPGSAIALRTFRTGVFINGAPAVWRPLADMRMARRIRVAGIRPIDGRVHVRFAVEAFVTRQRSSWQKASRVHFEFARLYQCDGATPDLLP